MNHRELIPDNLLPVASGFILIYCVYGCASSPPWACSSFLFLTWLEPHDKAIVCSVCVCTCAHICWREKGLGRGEKVALEWLHADFLLTVTLALMLDRREHSLVFRNLPLIFLIICFLISSFPFTLSSYSTFLFRSSVIGNLVYESHHTQNREK